MDRGSYPRSRLVFACNQVWTVFVQLMSEFKDLGWKDIEPRCIQESKQAEDLLWTLFGFVHSSSRFFHHQSSKYSQKRSKVLGCHHLQQCPFLSFERVFFLSSPPSHLEEFLLPHRLLNSPHTKNVIYHLNARG
jgi:hypothetical protein